MNACVDPDGKTENDPLWLCPIDERKLQTRYQSTIGVRG
jgi:hypothetical protein